MSSTVNLTILQCLLSLQYRCHPLFFLDFLLDESLEGEQLVQLDAAPRWIRDRRALRPETTEVQAQRIGAPVARRHRACGLRRSRLRPPSGKLPHARRECYYGIENYEGLPEFRTQHFGTLFSSKFFQFAPATQLTLKNNKHESIFNLLASTIQLALMFVTSQVQF